MRRVKPDDGEERPALPDSACDKGHHAVHDDARIVAFQVVSYDFIGTLPIMRAVKLTGPLAFCSGGLTAAAFVGNLHRVPGGNFRFGGETHVEAVLPRRRVDLGRARPAAVGFLDLGGERAEMPLAEVPGRVADFLERFG